MSTTLLIGKAVELCRPAPLRVDLSALDAHARFWAKVDRRGPDECWPWKAGRADGYGRFGESAGHVFAAHRYAYELLVGRIPEGLYLDHTCHNGTGCKLKTECPHRRCVNPAHLEPVTNVENVMRGETVTAAAAAKTECPHGHPYAGRNLQHPAGWLTGVSRVPPPPRATQERRSQGLKAGGGVMTVLLLDKAVALCRMSGHDIDIYDSTENDPGADICREDECYSQHLVGLWNASACLREAMAHLAPCGCESPEWCSCSFEYLRLTITKAERNIDHELSVLLAASFLDNDAAEAVLTGGA